MLLIARVYGCRALLTECLDKKVSFSRVSTDVHILATQHTKIYISINLKKIHRFVCIVHLVFVDNIDLSFRILEDDFHAEVFPPDFPSFLLVRVVQLLSLHQLPVVPEFKNYFNSILFMYLCCQQN